MKELNHREIGTIKRIFQNVDADYQKVCKLNAKIAELTADRDNLQAGIDEMEAPVIRKTGYKSTELINKVVIPQVNEDGSPKLDKDGRQIKITKYVYVGAPSNEVSTESEPEKSPVLVNEKVEENNLAELL